MQATAGGDEERRSVYDVEDPASFVEGWREVALRVAIARDVQVCERADDVAGVVPPTSLEESAAADLGERLFVGRSRGDVEVVARGQVEAELDGGVQGVSSDEGIAGASTSAVAFLREDEAGPIGQSFDQRLEVSVDGHGVGCGNRHRSLPSTQWTSSSLSIQSCSSVVRSRGNVTRTVTPAAVTTFAKLTASRSLCWRVLSALLGGV